MKVYNEKNSSVEQIKSILSIEDVISSYVKLEGSGKNLKARCPFHNEKTPSFFVSPDRGTYYCFGCGAKGDIFTFIQEFEGLDFKGALKVLADKAGISLEPFNLEKDGEKDQLFKIMEDSAQFFEKNLFANKKVLDYLLARGLSEKTIKDFRIGFAENDWRVLVSFLRKKGWTVDTMEKAGLIKKKEGASSDRDYYDRFRGRVMFPINDSGGRVIAFSGRIFEDDLDSRAKLTTGQVVNQPKYLNSPETAIFKKSSVLYGIDKAKESIRKNNFAILVEGQIDLVLSHQAGFKNTVASSGTALTDSLNVVGGATEEVAENGISNLGLLHRLSKNIILAFDSDKAGFNATLRAGKIALGLGMEVKIANLPEGKDPADIVSKEGIENWKKVIRESVHILDFLLEKSINKWPNDSRKIGKEIQELVLPFLALLESEMEKSDFIRKISARTGFKEDAVLEDLKRVEKKVSEDGILDFNKGKKVDLGDFRLDHIERKILGIIFWQESLDRNKSENNSQILSESQLTEMRSQFLQIMGLPASFLTDISLQNKEDLIFEAEVFYGNDADLNRDIKELFLNLKEEKLKLVLADKFVLLRKAEEAKDKEQSHQILKEIQEINIEIQNLKNRGAPFSS